MVEQRAVNMLESNEIWDVIIVGAGPCGLAMAARLNERTPAALFTDEEHRRFHWIRRHGKRVSLKHVKGGKISSGESAMLNGYKMAIIDGTDNQWLSKWNKLFQAFDISHLRSPMLWHVDPSDRDSLLAYAHRNGLENEMVEIKHVVGKEMSKHAKKKTLGKACGCKQSAHVAINARERDDYFRPSQALFRQHCLDVASHYSLDSGQLRRETLEDLDYGLVQHISPDQGPLFTVTTDQGRRFARTVILATGPANRAEIPRTPSMWENPAATDQMCHSMDIGEFPARILQERMSQSRSTNVLIVGGGLTSAQLSDLAIRRGVSKVWHIMRGPLRIKQFDVDLAWMGKYKNTEHARFWLADEDLERLDIIKAARGGGSITSTYYKKLRAYVASGRLQLHTNTHIMDAKLQDQGGLTAWKIETDPPCPDLPCFDYIYFATGVKSDFEKLPYLQKMISKYPIKGCGGFPCLTDDLMWKKDVPLFLVGKMASLRLGPASPNIGGAKLGAERVALALEELATTQWRQSSTDETGYDCVDNNDVGNDTLEDYASGHRNMYSVLASQV